MSNLRSLIDGVSSLTYDIPPEMQSGGFKVSDDVVVRRAVGRTGPVTNEVMVGTILAIGESTATVSLKKGGGRIENREVPLNQLSPVTLAFKRHSIQFQPAFRGRV